MSEILHVEDRGGVRVLFLSRGKANALTGDFCEEIHRAAYEKAREIIPDGRKAFVDSWFSEAGQRGMAQALARIHRG